MSGRGQSTPNVRLRPTSPADMETILAWLAMPDIEAWWGPATATQAEVRIAMESGHAICRVIESDGESVGYAHAVDASLWGDVGSRPVHREQGASRVRRRRACAAIAKRRGVLVDYGDGRMRLPVGPQRSGRAGL